MFARIRSAIRNQWAGLLALFLVLTGGSAYALSGSNTVFSDDIVDGQVRPLDIAAPAPWREVAPGSYGQNVCADPAQIARFCSDLGSTLTFVPWTNIGANFSTAAFYRDQLGIVRLKGVVVPPDGSPKFGGNIAEQDPIFRLPSGYRPETRRVFASVGRGDTEVSAGRVDVEPNGLVTFVTLCSSRPGDSDVDCSAYRGYVTLDGIHFRRDG